LLGGSAGGCVEQTGCCLFARAARERAREREILLTIKKWLEVEYPSWYEIVGFSPYQAELWINAHKFKSHNSGTTPHKIAREERERESLKGTAWKELLERNCLKGTAP
jgi:hypothetical protein